MSMLYGTKALLSAHFPQTEFTDENPERIRIFVGAAEKPLPPRYVIISHQAGRLTAPTYTGVHDYDAEAGVRLTVVAVLPESQSGSPAGAAEWLVEECKTALTGKRPKPGYSTFQCDFVTDADTDQELVGMTNTFYVADFSSNPL